MLLVIAIVGARGLAVFSGKKKMNEFPGGLQHGSERYWRLYRAHANAAENLPIVAIVVLTGTLLQVTAPMFERLPAVALAARVVQSIAHVASGSIAAVTVRFTAFATQYVCFGLMLVEILRAGSR
jgi:uncharacterized membrane protein YecN with MAPEG domain